jgi:hypothetical protein
VFVVYGDRDISAGKFRCTKAIVLRQVSILSVEVEQTLRFAVRHQREPNYILTSKETNPIDKVASIIRYPEIWKLVASGSGSGLVSDSFAL